jgi:hypothetical protein
VIRGRQALGLSAHLPAGDELNKRSIAEILMELGAPAHWIETPGPNSLVLK